MELVVAYRGGHFWLLVPDIGDVGSLRFFESVGMIVLKG